MTSGYSPEGFYDVFAAHGLEGLENPDQLDVDDPPIMATLGIEAPVTMTKHAIAPGETTGDFTRRMYGANTVTGRALIQRANDELKGTVNVPIR